jgi:Ca2+-transporting ATPase
MPTVGRGLNGLSAGNASAGEDSIENQTSLSPPFAAKADQVIHALHTDATAGLSEGDAAGRLVQYGPNELTQTPPESWWSRLARQFADLLIWILIAASAVSGILGEWLDAVAILIIVVLNGVLGFVQEGRAQQALAALRSLSTPHAKVIRDAKLRRMAAVDLVPGDRIELEPGDRVPADVRLIRTAGLRVEEAALTGESVPADKDHREVLAADASLGDRVNMAYMATSITAGTASAVVVATGMQTEIGQIAGMLQRQKPELTPLQHKLAELGKTLLWIVLGIVLVMFVLQVLRGGRVADAFLLSVSLAVAAVPEGLSAVVTVALALGLQRMARHNALVRRLPSVETLGAVTVICSDKTGTLTRNQMTVRELAAGGIRYKLTGSGYNPAGEFHLCPEVSHSDQDGNEHDEDVRSCTDQNRIDPQAQPLLVRALTVGAWCNHAQVARSDGSGAWEMVGDPTEGALAVAAMKAGIRLTDRKSHIVHEIPFSSDRKLMSVVVRSDDSQLFMYTKGAPEVVLGHCSHEFRGGEDLRLTDARRAEILDIARGMAAKALRVLGLAYRKTSEEQHLGETGLTFAGLAGMLDLPREEAGEAVARCLSAGIRPVMITGDHPDTAKAIARKLGIMTAAQRVVTGAELDRMDEATLAGSVEQHPAYARVTAAHKLRIVNAWRARGQIVAMTGDGVNDAPAIKAADVGIAMGITGTDVTKQASDMVLTDDNFASIVNAVEQGRTIYDNIRKFVHYLLATNAGEVLLMLVAVVVGLPAPLVAIQILWINLVTDALPAMALGIERPEPDVMQRPPRDPHERVITLRRGLRMLYHGALCALAGGAAFLVIHQGRHENLAAARTAAFCTLAFAQLLFSFACRSSRYTLSQLGILSNPWLLVALAISALLQLAVVTIPALQPLFKVVPIESPWHWLMIIALACTPAAIVEATKLIRQTHPS